MADTSDVRRGGMLRSSSWEALSLTSPRARAFVTIDAVYVPASREALRVLVETFHPACLLLFHRTGFIPVIYSAIRQKYYKGSVHLAEEEAAPIAVNGKGAHRAKPMTGWSILLMWIPAVSDLTGTTVSNSIKLESNQLTLAL